MTEAKIKSFQLVYKDNVISPVLVTTRCYGEWFSRHFDEYTAKEELWITSKTAEGDKGREWHPGTKIGRWFDKNCVNNPIFKCWYIPQNSKVMARLKKLQLAEFTDIIKYRSDTKEFSRMLRVYTVEQLVLYIKSNYNYNMDLDLVEQPIHIKVTDKDLEQIVMPKINKAKKSLF